MKKFWSWLGRLKMDQDTYKEVMSSRLMEFSPPENFLTLHSTGPSGEHQGSSLGQYVLYGEHNGAPLYRQRDTVEGGESLYLYRATNGMWAVGLDLEGEVGISSTLESDSVPSEGWECYDGGQWLQDPGLTVTRGPLSPCDSVKLELRGEALQSQSHCGGVYLPTGDWSAGHPVFKHSLRERYLSVGWRGWRVTMALASRCSILDSRATAWCPADPRASRSLWSGRYSWIHSDQEGDVILQCGGHD